MADVALYGKHQQRRLGEPYMSAPSFRQPGPDGTWWTTPSKSQQSKFVQIRPRGFLEILAESLAEDARQMKMFYQEVEELREKASKVKGIYEKWKKRFELVEKLIDPTTRNVTIFEEGMSWCLKGLSKILERDIEMTPYWQIIKYNFEVLKMLIEAEAILADAQTHLDDANKIANQVVDASARFLDDFDLTGGPQWVAFQKKSNELSRLFNEWMNLQNLRQEMPKYRRFQMLVLISGRRKILDGMLEQFAQIGADRTQLQLAMTKYRQKIAKMEKSGGLTNNEGELAKQADILKQLSDKNLNTPAVSLSGNNVSLSPEEKAKEAYVAVYALVDKFLTASRKSDDFVWQT